MRFNPIIIEKELKTKMRGWKSAGLVTAYLSFLGLVIFLYFISNREMARYSMDYFNPRVALNAYNALALIQFLLILAVTPALTAAAISGERERQTLDLLLCTNLSALSIIMGKVIASIAHIMLLIVASMPVLSTVFLFGGVRLIDLLKLFLFYIVTALMVASMGIFYSTLFRRSSVSMIVTYITLFFLIIGTPILFALWYVLVMDGRGTPLAQAMAFMFSNPLFGFSSVGGNTGNLAGGIFFGGILGLYDTAYYAVGRLSSSTVLRPWMVNVIFDIAAAAFFILAGAWKLKPVKGVRKLK